MIVFALVFGFLKMSGRIVNVVFEESKLSNDSSHNKQLANIHISNILFIIITAPSL